MAAIGLLSVKFWAYSVTGSQAVFSDAVESIVNVVAAALLIAGMVYAARPADRDHPFGHGKIEFFTAAFEGGLIFFAALLILWQSVLAWWYGTELREIDLGILLVFVAGVGNGGVCILQLCRVRKHALHEVEQSGSFEKRRLDDHEFANSQAQPRDERQPSVAIGLSWTGPLR